MFREMRRRKQQLADDEAVRILREGTCGVLAVAGDGGYPYAVPLSYVYLDGRIYLHSAKSGHKVDAIRADDRVSFCVVAADDVVPSEYTTYFRSAIAFGRARIMEDGEAKLRALQALGDKYNPGQDDALEAEVAKGMAHLHMIEIEIEHLTGKQAKELASAARPAHEAKAAKRAVARPGGEGADEHGVTPEMRAMAEVLAHPDGDPYLNARNMGFYCEQCG